MAAATSLLKSEMRRHLAMNLGLVATCVVAGTVVTNERGLFMPLGIHGMSETAKAFSAMFTPSTLLPGFTNVQMVAPLEPFDVTADARDLRRRLMDSFSDFSAPQPIDPATEVAQYSGDQVLSPTELAANDVAPAGAAAAAPAGDSGQGGQTASSTANNATAGGGTPFNQQVGNALASSQTQAVSETTGAGGDGTGIDPGDGTITTPGSPGDTTAPVPEPSMWAMMLAGFGVIGYMLRSGRRRAEEAAEA